jgi:hypothetical protein
VDLPLVHPPHGEVQVEVLDVECLHERVDDVGHLGRPAGPYLGHRPPGPVQGRLEPEGVDVEDVVLL